MDLQTIIIDLKDFLLVKIKESSQITMQLVTQLLLSVISLHYLKKRKCIKS